MTTRNDLVDDMQGVEQILCALDGIGKEIPDLEYLIRRAK